MSQFAPSIFFIVFGTVLGFAAIVKGSDDANPLESVVLQQAAAIQTLQEKVSALERKLGIQVAFKAHYSSMSVDVGDNAAFKFDLVDSNIGNGYDPNSGVFTAPASGVYVFFLSVMHDPTHTYIEASLDKSGTTLCSVLADSPNDQYDDGFCVGVTRLSRGDRVLAKRTFGGTFLHGGVWTSFAGVLISVDGEV